MTLVKLDCQLNLTQVIKDNPNTHLNSGQTDLELNQQTGNYLSCEALTTKLILYKLLFIFILYIKNIMMIKKT